jgi:hypothetical protein
MILETLEGSPIMTQLETLLAFQKYHVFRILDENAFELLRLANVRNFDADGKINFFTLRLIGYVTVTIAVLDCQPETFSKARCVHGSDFVTHK